MTINILEARWLLPSSLAYRFFRSLIHCFTSSHLFRSSSVMSFVAKWSLICYDIARKTSSKSNNLLALFLVLGLRFLIGFIIQKVEEHLIHVSIYQLFKLIPSESGTDGPCTLFSVGLEALPRRYLPRLSLAFLRQKYTPRKEKRRT